MRWQILTIAALLFCTSVPSRAGGPAFVAGSGYDPGVEGQPLIWAGGSVQYFTDLGDLSPILIGAQADALVAAAFSTWTSIPGIALTASPGGHLAEDVNGSNIVVASTATISEPADIASSAIGTPVGIVYDYDGTVTDALLGQGAGALADCFTNAVYGGPDNFSSSGSIAHALIVINGVCAATAVQRPDIQYRLIRVIGRTLGLGWSQANVNVLTRKPLPASADFAGFPLMHFADPISCVPVTICYPNPAAPAMDDTNALARLYPNSANSQPQGRIWGSVYFTNASGTAVQPMQGVNVVARLMQSGLPSRQYVVSSVSGFLFHGNAGNVINGYLDGNGFRYDRWGSSDLSLEGFFDLGQLTIPSGQTIAEYQLSVEGLDPNWSLGVEPYDPTQVTPSGSFAPVVVTVSNGSNAERDILLLGNETAQAHPGSGSTYTNPSQLPQGGAWGSWISGYGSADFFEFNAQANRTASVVVTALDENGQPTENKLLPVIGIWELNDQTGNPAPASTPSAFNSTTFAMTRLDAQFGVTESFRVGIADFRGDGRPDYFYQASLLYSDTLTPARLSVAGGVTTFNGTGFRPGLQVSVGSINGTTLSGSANQIHVAIPPGVQDGPATVQVTDPVSGAFSQMIGALTYGALPTDLLLMPQRSEPATPVGSAAANPVRVQAVAADGVTPVNGATVAWSSTNGLQFSVCGAATSCSVLTDEAGESSSSVTPTATGPSLITVALAPASYSPPQTQQTTVVGTSTALDLVALTPRRWIAQGATLVVPLTVETLNLGVPKANVTVNFTITRGTAVLSAPVATTGSSGLAAINAQITNQNADVQVSACVAPNNAPCQIFTLFSTPDALWQLNTVSGSSQIVPAGQSFQPLVMRVTDGSAAANPVMGINVIFNTTLARVSPNQEANQNSSADGNPVILGSSQTQVITSQDGLASVTPSAGNVGPCDVFIAVTAGQLFAQFQWESVAAIPQPSAPGHSTAASAPSTARFYANVDSPTLATEAVSAPLFSVPQGISNSNSNTNDETVADSHSSSYSGLTADEPSVGPTVIPSNPAMGDTVHSLFAEPQPIEADIPKKDADAPAAKPATPVEVQPSSAKGNGPSEDKRNCRELAADGPFFK
jgi:IPT/TIG domain